MRGLYAEWEAGFDNSSWVKAFQRIFSYTHSAYCTYVPSSSSSNITTAAALLLFAILLLVWSVLLQAKRKAQRRRD